jgi:hypothetical protein
MKTLYLFLIFIVILSSPVYSSIGASPASMSFENMLRGGYSEKTVTVSNPTESDIIVSIGGDGEISEWITAFPSTIELGPKSNARIVIKVEPPEDIANGIYKNNILVIGRPAVSGEGQMSVVGGVSLAITAEVVDNEDKGYEVRRFSVPATEECRPIEAHITIVNIGNVRTVADFEFIVRDDEQIFQTKSYTTESMLPTKEYRFLVEIPYEMEQYNCIPTGKYDVSFKSFLDGSLIHEETSPLIIAERGSLSILGELTNVKIPQSIEAGQLTKIEADFENKGELTYRAQLVAEIYSGDSLSQVVKGDVIEVIHSESKTLSLFYQPMFPGDYSARLYALDTISGARTDELEYQFSVSLSMIYMGGGLILLLVILILVKKFILGGKKDE